MWNIGADTEADSVQKKIAPNIPNYKIIKPIGEGGMGIIYLAEQIKPIKRQVALKVIKPGMDTRTVLSRFEAERQVLALLEHPNIARIYDAGMTDLQLPYFAMEYVDGIPVTTYCDQEKLTIEDRLKLFIQICHAIHHAHQKGIIHRDIKPSNILVTIQDGKPVPKIIDFGIAKAISLHLTEETIFTEQGQLIGTPEYMSPEQAELTNQDIDTRTDIYSLGILLYELLTGALPFEIKLLRKAAFGEIQRIIREESPPRPSTQLSKLGNEAKEIVSNRRTELRTLVNSLHQELEWIPLMAIRKERDHRYKSAADFAQDIQNYLYGNPLLAGPESSRYKVKKFIKRNRVTVTAFLLIMLTLIAGTIISTYFGLGQYEARKEAEKAERTAQEQHLKAQELLARAQLDRGTRLLNEGNRFGLLDLLEARINANGTPNFSESANRLWTIAYDIWSDRLAYVLPKVAEDIAFSPNGKLIAKADHDQVRLWDMETGLPHGPGLIMDNPHSVLFSPDGKLVAASSIIGKTQFLDSSTGQPIGPILKYNDGVNDLPDLVREQPRAKWSTAFSPDSKLLATASVDGTVSLWKSDTHQRYGKPLRHEGIVWTVAFSPNGKLLACGTRNKNTVQVWNVDSGLPHDRPLRFAHGVKKIIFSSDGDLLAVMSGHTVSLWQTETGKLYKQFYHYGLLDITFSPDGKLLATAGYDGAVRLWNVETGELYGQRLDHEAGISMIKFSPDGKLLASGGDDYTLRLWDISGGKPYGPPLHYHDRNVYSLAFSPDGQYIAAGGIGLNQYTYIWNVHPKLPTEIIPHYRNIRFSSISADTKVATIISENKVQLWDIAKNEPIGEPLQHDEKVKAAVLSGDGSVLCVGLEGAVQGWQVRSRKKMGPPLKINWEFFLNVSYDGKLLTCGSNNWACSVYELTTGKLKYHLPMGGGVSSAAFSPNGRILAVGTFDFHIRLWDLDTGQQLCKPLSNVSAMAFNSDGNLLATVSADETREVKLWEIGAGPPYCGIVLPTEIIKGKISLTTIETNDSLLIEQLDDENAQAWHIPTAPNNLKEIRNLTQVALAAKTNNLRQVAPCPAEVLGDTNTIKKPFGIFPSDSGDAQIRTVPVFKGDSGNFSLEAHLADSIKDFSATQGKNNWYYGYYDGDSPDPYSYNDFELLTFTDDHWSLDIEPSVWTSLKCWGGHPHGYYSISSMQHWAVRRWISPVKGSVEIRGLLAKANSAGGDGVTGYIIIDGKKVWDQYIEYDNTIGVSYNINAEVNIGSLVDFAISPYSDNQDCDGTIFTAVIKSLVNKDERIIK